MYCLSHHVVFRRNYTVKFIVNKSFIHRYVMSIDHLSDRQKRRNGYMQKESNKLQLLVMIRNRKLISDPWFMLLTNNFADISMDAKDNWRHSQASNSLAGTYLQRFTRSFFQKTRSKMPCNIFDHISLRIVKILSLGLIIVK